MEKKIKVNQQLILEDAKSFFEAFLEADAKQSKDLERFFAMKEEVQAYFKEPYPLAEQRSSKQLYVSSLLTLQGGAAEVCPRSSDAGERAAARAGAQDGLGLAGSGRAVQGRWAGVRVQGREGGAGGQARAVQGRGLAHHEQLSLEARVPERQLRGASAATEEEGA